MGKTDIVTPVLVQPRHHGVTGQLADKPVA